MTSPLANQKESLSNWFLCGTSVEVEPTQVAVQFGLQEFEDRHSENVEVLIGFLKYIRWDPHDTI